MNNKKHYSELKELYKDNSNRFFLIIAPPRSGSTVLEKVLYGSEDIDKDIHEPFMEFGRREGSVHIAYQKIYSSLNKLKEKTSNILIKEMSHDIIRENIFKKLFQLTSNTIVLNIRNPLLCVESRIIAMLGASPISLKDSTKKFILNRLKKKIKKSKFENIYKGYINSTVPNIKLLNEYAKIKGYNSWEEYINKFINMRYYREFGDFLLSNKERFITGFGWIEMNVIKKYLENKNKKLFIIDYKNFTSNPKKYAKRICKLWGIEYKEDMLTWEKGAYEHIGKVWYSSINNSTSVKFSIKTFAEISNFSLFIQEYLKKVAIPIYKELSSRETLK